MKYRSDIDGLRALAVLPVVLFHANLPGFSGGFIGVDVFFVISGFLITSIITREMETGRFSLWQFYERRARRILPALTVVTLATLMVGAVVLLPSELADLGRSTLATAAFASNMYFLLVLDYFGPAAEFAPLLHSWSLAVEEQFYLFFPPMLALVLARYTRLSACWLVLLLSLLSLAAAIVILPHKPSWVFYALPFRAWELGAGALLALGSWPRLQHKTLRNLLGFAALLAVLAPVFLYSHHTLFPGLAAVPPVLGACVLIYLGITPAASDTEPLPLANRLLSHPLLVGIGLISYSLYLWHWPVMAYGRLLLGQAKLPLELGLVTVVLSFALAWLSYRYVERPFRGNGGLLPSRAQALGAAGLTLTLLLAVGAALHLSQGLPTRLTDSSVALYATKSDRNPRRPECFNLNAETPLCQLGAARSPEQAQDFLFWGDSHADAMMPGLAQAAAKQGQSGLFAGHSACVPVPQLRRQPESHSCSAHNARIWQLLQQRDDLPLVILGARWVLSAEGNRYAGEAGKNVVLDWAGPAAERPDTPGNAALLEAGLKATITAIRATGRDVVVLGPVPEVGWDVPTQLARSDMLGLTPPNAPSRAAFEHRSQRTTQILSQVAAETGARYLPLDDLFCAETTCHVQAPTGGLFYVDDDHISRFAAETLLAPRLDALW